MAYTLTNPPSEKCDLTPKNRVWGFFENSNRTRPANRRKPSELRRKIRLTPTKTASGIPYWPSRDPIGENGGLNLYGFVYNSPLSWIDVLGGSPAWADFRSLPYYTGPRDFPAPPPTKKQISESELRKGYDNMKQANYIGSDQWYHCMAMCRAARAGDSDHTDYLGVLKELADQMRYRALELVGKGPKTEIRDEFGNVVVHPATGKLKSRPMTPIEIAQDSLNDVAVNRQGINCPPEKSCKCCCEDLKPPGFDPGTHGFDDRY